MKQTEWWTYWAFFCISLMREGAPMAMRRASFTVGYVFLHETRDMEGS